jgi:flagellar hook protein FlgE
MNAAETMIDVAGNNIANANTIGFKESSVQFANQFLQTQGLGSSPDADSGGTDPEQTGLGAEVAAISPDFSQGTIQVTSNPDDLAIQGNGFFIVQGDEGQQLYTRDGSFSPNAQNQLVTTTGQLVLGRGVNSQFQLQNSTLSPLTIPLGSASVAQATQNVVLQGTLPPSNTVDATSTPEIIQSQVLSDGNYEVPPNLGTNPNNLFAVSGPVTTNTTATLDTTTPGSLTNNGTYQYEITYSYTNANGQVEQTPPSAIIGPVTTSAAGQSIDLTNLPPPPAPASGSPAVPPYTAINIYRTAGSGTGPYYQVTSVSASTTSYTDTASDAQIETPPAGSASPVTAPASLGAGNYSYYVAFKNSTTGVTSQPTALIGPISLAQDGSGIELNGIPSPTTSEFNEVVIYRNTADNSSTFYQVATVPSGTSSYIDTTPDSGITSNPQVDLNGPAINAGTLLTNVVALQGSTYTHPFQIGTLNFTGSVGGSTLSTKTFAITATTTVAQFQNFVDQAFGIQLPAADPTNPIPGNPGASITSSSQLQFTGNNGTANALDISSSSFSETLASGTTVPIDLGFNSTQTATGTSTSTTFVTYDSLGNSVNVTLTMVLESTSSSGTTYRWFADSPDNQPASGVGTAVGTGEITFDGNGNLLSTTNTTVSIDRTGSAAVSPLQFNLNFSQVSGLAAETSTTPPSIAAASQDGSAPGTLASFSVGSNGLITGVFSNGISRTLGQVVLANFSNNEGLSQQGQNLYAAGVDSGLPIVGAPGQQGIGSLVSGATEASNTDVGQNLIDLITASTTYRGGSQVITTIQQLYNTLLQLETA